MFARYVLISAYIDWLDEGEERLGVLNGSRGGRGGVPASETTACGCKDLWIYLATSLHLLCHSAEVMQKFGNTVKRNGMIKDD